MKKFKIFIATLMAYLILVSIMPIKALETITKAEENLPTYLKYNSIYLQSVAQYKNKSLVVREKMYDRMDRRVLSLVEDGKEKLLVDSEDVADINLVSGNGDKAQVSIQYEGNPVIDYMEYNFITDEFSQISPGLFKNNLEFKRIYNSFLKEKFAEDILKRVKEKYGVIGSVNNDFDIFILNDNTRTIKFSLYIGSNEYYGVYNDNFEIISEHYLQAYINKDKSISIREFLSNNDDKHMFKITKVKDGKVIDSAIANIIRDTYEPIEIIGDKLYVENKSYGTFREYVKTDGEYKYSNEYYRVTYSNIAMDVDNNAWFVSNGWVECTGRISDAWRGRSRWVCKLENGNCINKYQIPYLAEQVQLYVYDDSHIIVSSEGGSIFIDENYVYDENTEKEDKNNKKDETVSTEKDSTDKKDNSKIENTEKENENNKKDEAVSEEKDSTDKKDNSKIENTEKEDKNNKKDEAVSTEKDSTDKKDNSKIENTEKEDKNNKKDEVVSEEKDSTYKKDNSKIENTEKEDKNNKKDEAVSEEKDSTDKKDNSKIENTEKEDKNNKKDEAVSEEKDSTDNKDNSKIENTEKEDKNNKKDEAVSEEKDSSDKKDNNKIENTEKEDKSNEKDEVILKEKDNREDIIVKNIDDTTIEAILKDVQGIKDGKDIANIKLNDNMEIKLPFSIIDTSLLDGAKDIKVKLNIIKDSDIVKDRKALNKVFDFQLFIDKENEEIAVHNFANGVIEVKLTLTDEELKGLDKNNLCVFYYNEENKNFEPVETILDGNNIIFKTSHFSKYVLAENIKQNNNVVKEKNNTVKSTLLPNTGSVIDTKTIIFGAVLLILIGGSLLFIKKKRNVKILNTKIE